MTKSSAASPRDVIPPGSLASPVDPPVGASPRITASRTASVGGAEASAADDVDAGAPAARSPVDDPGASTGERPPDARHAASDGGGDGGGGDGGGAADGDGDGDSHMIDVNAGEWMQ